jgi:hypothetical protein
MKTTMHHTFLAFLFTSLLLLSCRSAPVEGDVETPAALVGEAAAPATAAPTVNRMAPSATSSATPAHLAVILTAPEGQQPIPPIVAALKYQEESAVYLLGDLGQVAGKVEVLDGYLSRFAWFNRGCKMLLFISDGVTGHIQIVDFNLGSREATTLYAYDVSTDANQDRFLFAQPSPDRRWLAYMVWSGERYYRGAEHQDVEIVRLDGSGGPFALSERGGVWWRGGAWSPDGSRYAYSDYDENGQSQLFHSAPDGSDRFQVTSFQGLAEDVGPVQWSPDGSRLAFSSWSEGHSRGSMWMATADGTAVLPLGPEGMPRVVAEAFWWSQDGETIVALTVPSEGEEPPGGLYWLDINGAVQHRLSYDAFPLGFIIMPFPTTDSDIVRFGDFYEYNRRNQSLVRWPADEHLPEGLIDAIEAPPNGSVDVASCRD